MDKDEYRQAALTVDRGLPVFVLALDEQKLPSLVTRLAARRLDADADSPGGSDYVASVDVPAAKDAEAEAKTQSAVVPSPSRISGTRDLSGKDSRGVPAPVTPPPAATATPAAPAEAARTDAGKLAGQLQKPKEESAQTPRLVFVRVFLTRPLPAADAKPAAVPPAK
jgi:hypothetical protein